MRIIIKAAHYYALLKSKGRYAFLQQILGINFENVFTLSLACLQHSFSILLTNYLNGINAYKRKVQSGLGQVQTAACEVALDAMRAHSEQGGCRWQNTQRQA